MRTPRMLTVAAAVLVAVFGAPAPAPAHTAVLLTVNHDGRGSISVDVSWADGHPVTGALAATMTAVSPAADPVGPVALVRLPNRPTVVLPGALPAGRWRVVVDAAVPAIGHCEVTVDVGAADAGPSATRCGEPAPATPASTRAARADEPRWPVAWVAVAIMVASGAVLAGLLVHRRGRTRRPTGQLSSPPARR